MVKINLPQETLQKEAFRSLPAKEKEEYIRNLLQKILQLNPEGVTTSQIKEATNLTYSTIWHHLEFLSSTAQSNKVAHGNLDVYYPAGDIKHLNDFNKGKIRYTVSTVENKDGKFVCIYEQRENRLGNYATYRGVHIPFELIDTILNDLSKVKKAYLNEKQDIKK